MDNTKCTHCLFSKNKTIMTYPVAFRITLNFGTNDNEEFLMEIR